ncbi:MAG TPA: SDR family NAD(P)-dependent oxidoreductase [Acidimicrobiales bacterium]|nr:SDR family NAD(P)-dependent oxidoreductase [Acidimicrobiales bacterium]
MRNVVVTGGAGAIGAAVINRFRTLGDTVTGLDLHAEDGVIACDVSDETSVASAFATVREQHGPVEVLVHSAGITGRGTVTDEDPATWRRILEVNLTSAYLSCREAIPDMARLGRGRIVLIASVNGRFGGSALSGPAYATSKGGLITLARFLAREHAAHGITVNAVAPGPHDTPMWTALDPDRRERILAMIPGGRGPGDPDDLAATILHLCSAEAWYINGATIDVNGGQWMG